MIVFRWASLFQLVPTGRSLSIGKFTLAAITARKKSKESGTVSGWLASVIAGERLGPRGEAKSRPKSGSRRAAAAETETERSKRLLLLTKAP